MESVPAPANPVACASTQFVVFVWCPTGNFRICTTFSMDFCHFCDFFSRSRALLTRCSSIIYTVRNYFSEAWIWFCFALVTCNSKLMSQFREMKSSKTKIVGTFYLISHDHDMNREWMSYPITVLPRNILIVDFHYTFLNSYLRWKLLDVRQHIM